MDDKSYVGMTHCFFCGEPNGLLLDRRLKPTLPRNIGVVDMTPCNECKEWMKKGIICISIADDTSEDEMKGPIPNPRRTGQWAVIKEEAIRLIINGALLEHTLKERFMFITDSAWNKLMSQQH